jgi:hypothetical protein
VTDGTPFAVWFLSVIACGLADLALTATWRPALFRRGPVLYRREVSRIVATPRLPVRRLRICFRTSFCIPIEFKRQSPEECFFRERILLCNCNCYIGYFPVLVGRITLDGSRAAVEGRPRWGYLLMLLVIVVGLSLLSNSYLLSLIVFAFIVPLVAISRSVQLSRFDRVVSVLEGESH